MLAGSQWHQRELIQNARIYVKWYMKMLLCKWFAGTFAKAALEKHVCGEWGSITPAMKLNEVAVKISEGEKLNKNATGVRGGKHE